MELCRQYGFIFICEILLVLNCESYPSNLHCDPATSYIYAIQGALNMVGKRTLTMIGEITKDKANVSYTPLSFNIKYKSKPIERKMGYF